MKLKEKLANSIACDIGPQSLLDCKRLELAAVAGFEKARSLAAKIAYDPSFDGTGDKIDCLGEEEV